MLKTGFPKLLGHQIQEFMNIKEICSSTSIKNNKVSTKKSVKHNFIYFLLILLYFWGESLHGWGISWTSAGSMGPTCRGGLVKILGVLHVGW